MNLKSKNHTQGTDLFFTLSLFGVFAVSAFLLIMIGVQVYQSSVVSMEDTYSTRTSLAYVTEKIRQHDIAGNIFLDELDGNTALVLKDTVNSDTYLTYIYSDHSHLYELSVKEGTPVSSDLGEKILDVKDFSITALSNGFLEFSASDSEGNPVTLLLHLRSEDL